MFPRPRTSQGITFIHVPDLVMVFRIESFDGMSIKTLIVPDFGKWVSTTRALNTAQYC